jgi:hypothetical protein
MCRVDEWNEARSSLGDLERPDRAGAHAGAAATSAPLGLCLLAPARSATRPKTIAHTGYRNYSPSADINWVAIRPANPSDVDFRIGIHQGDVAVEDGDIFGDGVNVAARLARARTVVRGTRLSAPYVQTRFISESDDLSIAPLGGHTDPSTGEDTGPSA